MCNITNNRPTYIKMVHVKMSQKPQEQASAEINRPVIHEYMTGLIFNQCLIFVLKVKKPSQFQIPPSSD